MGTSQLIYWVTFQKMLLITLVNVWVDVYPWVSETPIAYTRPHADAVFNSILPRVELKNPTPSQTCYIFQKLYFSNSPTYQYTREGQKRDIIFKAYIKSKIVSVILQTWQ